MTIAHKITTIAGLAGALVLGGLAATPAAQAQGPFGGYGFHHHFGHAQFDQLRQADRLNHQATVQADRGHFAKAAQLHRRAAQLRAAARHGY